MRLDQNFTSGECAPSCDMLATASSTCLSKAAIVVLLFLLIANANGDLIALTRSRGYPDLHISCGVQDSPATAQEGWAYTLMHGEEAIGKCRDMYCTEWNYLREAAGYSVAEEVEGKGECHWRGREKECFWSYCYTGLLTRGSEVSPLEYKTDHSTGDFAL